VLPCLSRQAAATPPRFPLAQRGPATKVCSASLDFVTGPHIGPFLPVRPAPRPSLGPMRSPSGPNRSGADHRLDSAGVRRPHAWTSVPSTASLRPILTRAPRPSPPPYLRKTVPRRRPAVPAAALFDRREDQPEPPEDTERTSSTSCTPAGHPHRRRLIGTPQFLEVRAGHHGQPPVCPSSNSGCCRLFPSKVSTSPSSPRPPPFFPQLARPLASRVAGIEDLQGR
jgi:hypothetical protein